MYLYYIFYVLFYKKYMDPDNIDDVRTDFKNITFSNFQKFKARQELIKASSDERFQNMSDEFTAIENYLDEIEKEFS